MSTPVPLGFQFGSPLTEADYELLSQSYITPAIADSAFLRRVSSQEGREMFGRRDYDDYAGLIFPCVFPGQPGARSHRLRRDNPPVSWEQGAPRLRDKYISPPGYGNILYFHPATSVSSLTDIQLPLVLLEGQKKTLAVFRMAWEAKSETSEAPLFVPVG